MENVVYTIDNDERSWKDKVKSKVKKGVHNTKKWIGDHAVDIIIFGPAVVSATISLGKYVDKKIDLKRQENLRTRYMWDPSLGHYWHLRRDLTNAECLEIERRHNNGETIGNILESLKVLK